MKSKNLLCFLLIVFSAQSIYAELYNANYWVVADSEINKPHVTNNTKRIVIDCDPQAIQISPFYNGLAYVNTPKNGKYYIDKEGNRVFDYEAKKYAHIPRFDKSGYAIDCDKNTAIIFDRQGNVVKTIPNVQKVTNFVDGIAAITISRKINNVVDYVNTYVDVEGNRFFQSGIEPKSMENLKEERPLSDGLSAVYS